MSDDFIYLDYNATTPSDPRVAEAMKPYLSGFYGNPSSMHRLGRQARRAVDQARTQVAACLGCRDEEIIFTSGGSESNNLAIRGAVMQRGGGHVITSAVEHPAVLEVVRALEAEGQISLTIVPVDHNGIVDPDEVKRTLRDDTVLVTIMLANNEVGAIQPIREIAALCRERRVLMHTDAAQAIGKIPVDVAELGVDLLSVAGHKLYAPKGIGALYVRDSVSLVPLIRGANHERGRRAGTENVLEQVGLGCACELVGEELLAEIVRLRALRQRLFERLKRDIPALIEHGDKDRSLPNTLSVAFPGVNAESLLALLGDDVAASAGAACHADKVVVSHVLTAMGIDEATALATLRFSVGRFTTEDEIDRGTDMVLAMVRQLASTSNT